MVAEAIGGVSSPGTKFFILQSPPGMSDVTNCCNRCYLIR